MELTEGLELHGFRVRDITPLPEINATLYRLDHLVTGARMAHLATADDNNLFGVTFRTTPKDSTGVAHILEHTVLCGSRRYPVRDPFFAMIKRSLNTFMNALTSSDWTMYPFSSQNQKDFYNLLGIYLDAAFSPLLRERDFRQEGHRLEFAEPDNPDSPLLFKGVVYNEMKGAMADPSSLIGRRLTKALFPTVTYGHNSGGEPSAIPGLTYEALKEFHATYYHPSNAWFFTYGNFPLEPHLQAIQEQALRHFSARPLDSAVPPEQRFGEPRRAKETFPVDPGEPLLNRAMVQLGWLTCPVTDSFERLAMSILSNLLLGNPAAPLYKALLDSRLGQNLAPGTGYHDDYRDTLFAAGLQGTNPEALEGVEEVVLQTLAKMAREGFTAERIEAAIHQLEFAHKEVSGDHYPYPLGLLMRMIGPWMHNDDPLTPLALDRDLQRLRREVAAGPFFQELIRRQLLDNPHRVTLLLQPDPSQGEREERETASHLERIRRSLSEEDRQRIIEQARELQQAQETQEDLSVLPTLELSDIPAEERPVTAELQPTRKVPVYWLDQPTNGIGYFTINLPTAALPEELRPYLPVFSAVLTQMGAAGHRYEEMAERIAAATGGLRAATAILDDPYGLEGFRPALEVKGKALVRNQGRMFGILADFFTAPDFSDHARLHTVLNQVKVSMENSIPSAGHSYAARIAAGRLTPAAQLRERWSGLTQLRLVRSLAALRPEELEETAEKLRRLAALLLVQDRAGAAVTAEQGAFSEIGSVLEPFLAGLARGNPAAAEVTPPFVAEVQGTGWASSLPVSYVARAFRTVPFTHADSGSLMVLARLLRSGYLHREIREKGGAYGGMANFDPESGIFSMLSYRDPHLTRTLRVYREAAEWAAAGRFSAEEIKEAVLAVFSALDRPLSPGGRGYREFANRLQGLKKEMRQELREKVLATDREALVRAAESWLLANWAQSAVAVISSDETLRKANGELPEGERLVVEKI